MRNLVRTISAFIIIIILALCSITGYYIYSLPESFYVTRGTNLKLSCFFDVEATNNNKYQQIMLGDEKVMQSDVTLKLFGVIPIKEVTVKPVDTPVLIPGGNPFGIKLITEGVIVIGMAEVDSCDGNICPASKSGIQIGDIIISINGNKMTSNQDVAEAIMKSQGEKVVVKIKRGNQVFEVNMEPSYSLSEATFKAGIWVRDSSAGIGTITFYDPQTKMFGGLGHPVCDVDTGEIMPLHSGQVVAVTINGVTKGRVGQPGELLGSFVSNFSVGSILLNTNNGLFGELDSPPNQSVGIPMGYRQDVRTGHATILTTIKGNTPKEYSIEIEKIDMKNSDQNKNLVIKITDPELLENAGGILQGMSGSPIIQDGKLVGAVTHVFVNDPTKGYGVFVDTMYSSALNLAQNAA